MSEYAKFFTELDKGDAAIAGGKGASLGEMSRIGIPVPPGFVVTAGAYERFISETQIGADIEAQLKKINPEDTNSVEQASETIRAMIASKPMPTDLQKHFLAVYNKLGSRFVAVRSSATAEDSKTASWAGELESYMFVNENNLLEKIQLCWSSLFTPRAIFYRFEKKLHQTKVSVAVVVQKMVNSDISGIAFTVHPVTKDKNQMVIEVAWGLGDTIVGGMVTPDTYIVGKPMLNNQSPRNNNQINFNIQNSKLQILDIFESEQDFKLIYKPGGGHMQVPPSESEKGRKLSNVKIIEVAKICLVIEKHYGIPMDIEFAIEDGKIYIVQSRPITTL